MEAFEHLPQEKRERVINGAMRVFATHGYHKSSAADIASAAGISKAMVFTYFGSKRGCYEYLCGELLRTTLMEFNKVSGKLLEITDYFERVIFSAQTKVSVLRHYPALLSFATSVVTERDEEVRPAINRMFAEAYKLRDMFLLTDIDATKFREPEDAVRVNKMTTWLSHGCAEEWSRCEPEALDGVLAEFVDCIRTLKKYFYKEAYI